MPTKPPFKITGLQGEPVELILTAERKVLKDLIRRGRLQAMQRAFMFKIADWFHRELRKRAPRDIKGYRQALRMFEVKPNAVKFSGVAAGAKTIGYTIHVHPKKMVLDDELAKQRVVYVSALQDQPPQRRKPWVDVLIAHSPWTDDTLPISPSVKEAVVVFRMASKREVAVIRARRNKELPAVRQELSTLGVALPPKREKLVGMDDIAFQALRLEFGFSGRKRPLWRPLLKESRARLISEWTRNKKWMRLLMDPKNREWMRWRSTPRKLPKADKKLVQSFREFTRRVQL